MFLGIGSALTRAGPLSVLLGYTFTGIAIFAMMQCLGEMATWLPLPGAIPQFCARYVDEALGFAVGWNVSCFDHPSDVKKLLYLGVRCELEQGAKADSLSLTELVCICNHTLCRNFSSFDRDSVLARS